MVKCVYIKLPLIVLGLLTAPIKAQSTCAAGMATASAFCFTSDVIEALSLAHTAALTKPDTTGVQGNLVGLGSAVLYVSARQRTGIDEALGFLAKYRSSRDSLIAAAANETVRALIALRLNSLPADSLFRDALNGKQSTVGSQAQKIADLQNRRHTAAKLLLLSVIAATYPLLEPDPNDTNHERLKITVSDQEYLLKRMQSAFGEDLKPSPATGQYTTDYAAAIQALNVFLRQSWRTRL